MSKLIFKPDDFLIPELIGKQSASICYKKAQQIYDEWLEKQTVVFGKHPDLAWYVEHKQFDSTHKAYLVCIEEIKECEHKNVGVTNFFGPENGTKWSSKWVYRCQDCNKQLKPKNGWEVISE